MIYPVDRVIHSLNNRGQDNNLRHRFSLGTGIRGYALTVEESSKTVFVLGAYWSPEGVNVSFDHNRWFAVEVYETNGGFLRNFVVHGTIFSLLDITACNDGRVLVLTTDCVQVFSAQGVL